MATPNVFKATPESIVLVLKTLARVQRDGGVCAIVGVGFDVEIARRLGVDLRNLLVSSPDDDDMADKIEDHLKRTGAVAMIVVEQDDGMLRTWTQPLPGGVHEIPVFARVEVKIAKGAYGVARTAWYSATVIGHGMIGTSHPDGGWPCYHVRLTRDGSELESCHPDNVRLPSA